MRKELENLSKDKTENLVEFNKKVERVKVGSIKPKENHVVFEFNIKTFELKKANFDLTIGWNGKRSITVNEDCIYLTALNDKNAVKKIKKLLNT